MSRLRFEDQVVWITGGGSGIGRALAAEFARQGADVAVSGRRADRLAEVAAEVEALGRRALAVPLDVTDDGAVAAAVTRVKGEFGRLDVAVANAGFSVAGRISELAIDEWRRQFDVNVFGVISTIRHALPALRATDGRIVLIGSVAGLLAAGGTAPYGSSKFAVRAIGLALAQELHGSGVSCTVIAPGFVESEIGQVDNRGVYDGARVDERPQRLMWSAERAARVTVNAIFRRKREYVFTWHGRAAAWLSRFTPGLVHVLMTRGFKRGAMD